MNFAFPAIEVIKIDFRKYGILDAISIVFPLYKIAQ